MIENYYQGVRIPTMLTIKELLEVYPCFTYDRIRRLCLSGKIVSVRAGGGKFLINLEKFADYLCQGDNQVKL